MIKVPTVGGRDGVSVLGRDVDRLHGELEGLRRDVGEVLALPHAVALPAVDLEAGDGLGGEPGRCPSSGRGRRRKGTRQETAIPLRSASWWGRSLSSRRMTSWPL
ncbi:hypothetical protein CP967_20015 [Streptomyces nitrosporeus]|uniref:Uncharacterized protein n=1 Tax=Streptomyces nitrosporeus TaxID=28894 RepID=A0A5J6FG82_9ACTN|nr:hypothetical protein CP967_20015 [Streptomyces nitrosporeus]GGZ00842.1 hypothetical protein GCM10010327_34170 [Streptomyces nitrosporeus]